MQLHSHAVYAICHVHCVLALQSLDDLETGVPQETAVDKPEDNPPSLLPGQPPDTPDTPKRGKKKPRASGVTNGCL